MAKWTEVDIYTGLVKKVDEDAPANSVAGGGVALPPDAMMKKKKKRLIDARTKEYRQHRARLEKLRAQRQSKTNNMNEEQLDEMKKASVEFDRRNKSDMMKAKKDLEKKGHKVDVSTTLTTNTLVVTAKRGSDIGREIKDVMNFYNGAKRAKALESVGEETLDEFVRNAPKGMTTYKVSDNKLQGNMDAKDAKDLEKQMKAKGFNMKKATIYYHKGTSSSRYYIMRNGKPVSEETLDEGRMKELAMKIADVYTKMKKDRTMKPFADKFRQDVKKSLDIRKSLEKVLPDYVSGGSITKLMAGYENYGEEREEDIKEGTWHIAKNYSQLKRAMKKPMKKNPIDAENEKIIYKHIGDDELHDDIARLKNGEDMRPAVQKAMKRLGMKEGMSFIDKVQEQIGEFGKESLLVENNMDVIKSVVKSKGAKNIKMKDGSLKMDLFTASAIMNIYDKVNPSNKKKIEALANGKKSDLMKLQSMAMKLHKK